MQKSNPLRSAAPAPDRPAATDPSPIFLTTTELAARWKVSRAVLTRWRLKKCGPGYVQIGPKGGAVLYRLSEIEAFEQARAVKTDLGAGCLSAGGASRFWGCFGKVRIGLADRAADLRLDSRQQLIRAGHVAAVVGY